jgi:hypothetical protein
MTIQKLFKVINNLKGESEEISELKNMTNLLQDKISSSNKKQYQQNIELSRLKRKLNNSKQAIKKIWKVRNEKSKRSIFSNKEHILKHIKIIRDTKKEIEIF